MNDQKSLRVVLSENIKYLMQLRKWDQKSLAKKANISQKTISNTLNKNYATNLDTLEKISDAFKITSWQLLVKNLDENMIQTLELKKNIRNERFIMININQEKMVTNPSERSYVKTVS